MTSRKKALRTLLWAGIILLQVIMTQFVTFVGSMPFPKGMEGYPQSHPVIFVVFLGITYSIGVFYTGWVAIKKRWISVEPKFRLRLVCTLAGAYIPLILALILYHPLEPGNPFFFISIFTCILGFYVPGWIQRG